MSWKTSLLLLWAHAACSFLCLPVNLRIDHHPLLLLLVETWKQSQETACLPWLAQYCDVFPLLQVVGAWFLPDDHHSWFPLLCLLAHNQPVSSSSLFPLLSPSLSSPLPPLLLRLHSMLQSIMQIQRPGLEHPRSAPCIMHFVFVLEHVGHSRLSDGAFCDLCSTICFIPDWQVQIADVYSKGSPSKMKV